jgi:hypothetical protein
VPAIVPWKLSSENSFVGWVVQVRIAHRGSPIVFILCLFLSDHSHHERKWWSRNLMYAFDCLFERFGFPIFLGAVFASEKDLPIDMDETSPLAETKTTLKPAEVV